MYLINSGKLQEKLSSYFPRQLHLNSPLICQSRAQLSLSLSMTPKLPPKYSKFFEIWFLETLIFESATSMSNPSSSGWDSSSNLTQFGIGLANTVQSDVASHLPLPSLPIFCGSTQPGEFKLFDEAGEGISGNRSLNRSEILSQSRRIANMLEETDVSYL